MLQGYTYSIVVLRAVLIKQFLRSFASSGSQKCRDMCVNHIGTFPYMAVDETNQKITHMHTQQSHACT